MTVATNYPEGYLDVSLHRSRMVRARLHGGGGWRPPIHGVHVFASDDGTVLGVVRTLGILLPKAKRRYALKVEGVTFIRIVPLISKTRPIRSDLAAYNTVKRALAEGAALIERLRTDDLATAEGRP